MLARLYGAVGLANIVDWLSGGLIVVIAKMMLPVAATVITAVFAILDDVPVFWAMVGCIGVLPGSTYLTVRGCASLGG